MHAVGGCEVKLVAGFDIEEVVPCIDIAEGTVDALAIERMDVGLDAESRVAEEEIFGLVRSVLLAV